MSPRIVVLLILSGVGLFVTGMLVARSPLKPRVAVFTQENVRNIARGECVYALENALQPPERSCIENPARQEAGGGEPELERAEIWDEEQDTPRSMALERAVILVEERIQWGVWDEEARLDFRELLLTLDGTEQTELIRTLLKAINEGELDVRVDGIPM